MDLATYIAAMFDGEGNVCGKPVNKCPRRVSIYNTEKVLLDKCMEACKELGIYATLVLKDCPSLHTRELKPLWMLTITGQQNLRLFYEKVPFCSEIKRRNFETILDSYQHKAYSRTKVA